MKKRILKMVITSLVLMVVSFCVQTIPAIAAQQPAKAAIDRLHIDKSVISNGLDTYGMEKLPSEGEGWKYDINTNTLTLSDFKGTKISVGGFTDNELGNSILTDNKILTIELVGKSVIDEDINIYNVDVKIKGNGSLKINNVNAYSAPFWVREGNLQLSGNSKVEITGAKEGLYLEMDIRGGKLTVDKGCTLVAKTTAEGDSSNPGIAIKCGSIKAGGTIIGETAVGKAYNKGIWVSHECYFDTGITLKSGDSAKSLKTVALFKALGNNYIDSHNTSRYMEISTYKEAKKASSLIKNTIINENPYHYGAPEFVTGDYLYKITKAARRGLPGEATVYSNYSDINNAIIPEIVINDATDLKYKVTAVGERAFYKCENLVSVTIPKGVTTIEKKAFQDCPRLRIANVPEGVTTIENEAFYWCRSLKNLTLPSTLKKLGEGAFYGNQVEAFTVPKGVTELPNSVFEANYSLKTVILPAGLTKINSGAFANCQGLINLVIPVKVSFIGACTFSNCFSLTKINIPQGITQINDAAFQNCSGLSSIDIPQKVTSIGQKAFMNCKGLTSINIPDKVKSIGEQAFNSCIKLQKINIPVSVTQVEEGVFWNCPALTAITLPKGIKSIGIHAFLKCGSLEKIILPEGVSSIGEEAFMDCAKLAEITIPKSVKQIGKGAFSETKWFENQKSQNKFVIINGILLFATVTDGEKIVIPKEVTTIGGRAFENSLVGSVSLTDKVTSIGKYAFGGCKSLTQIDNCSKVTDIETGAFVDCSNLSGFTIPENIINIGSSAFKGTAIKNVKLPKTLKTLEGYTFENCVNIESIIIPDTVRMSGGDYFNGCTSLKTVVLGSSVEFISGFSGCTNLESVILPKTAKMIHNKAFSECPKLKSIYIPDGYKEYSISDTAFDIGITIICKKDSGAYKWAKKYGYTIKLK